MTDKSNKRSTQSNSANQRQFLFTSLRSVSDHINQRWSLLTILALTITATSMAAAQAQTFDISSGEAAESLNEFARQAGVSVVYRADKVAGYETNAVDGSYAPAEALTLMLADTGLHLIQGQGEAFAVQASADGSDESSVRGGTSGNAPTTLGTILIAQASENRQTTYPTSDRSEGEASVVSGKVTDARTRANLKGALVKIGETGQTAITNELGEFRFPNVDPSYVTLVVSYLGYASQSAAISVRGLETSRNFALRGGSDVEEIIVFGQRSARASALNLQRTAQNNSTVISADLLGQFSSTNLPDALRRVPGISFNQDPRTGQPFDITVRGLTRDLNSIQLNGISVPGDGSTRFANITNILTDSIESVTVSKSLLPSQESNGTGGLIEIETKTPLDRPDNVYQFGYERAEGIDDRLTTNYYTATLSRKFTEAENLGLSLSAQYSDDESSGSSLGAGAAFGSYLPSGVASINDIDPRLPFPFIGGSEDILFTSFSSRASEVERDILNLVLSAAYVPHPSTTVRADYNYIDSESVRVTSGVSFNPSVSFAERPVASLGGEERAAAEWTGRFRHSRQLGINPSESTSHSISLRTDTSLGRWSINTVVGYSERDNNINGDFSASFEHQNQNPDLAFFVPEIVSSAEGIILSPLDQSNGVPLFSEAGYTEYIDQEQLLFTGGNFNLSDGTDTRLHFEGDVRFAKPLPFVNYVAVGVDVEDLELRWFNDTQSISGSSSLGAATMSSQIDAFSGVDSAGIFGITPPSGSVGYRDFIQQNSGNGGAFTVSDFLRDPLLRETFTEELNVDYYLEASLAWRDFELVGGIRVATADVEAAIASSPSILGPGFTPLTEIEERLRGISIQTAMQTDVLPRLLMNYRPADNVVARLGYYRTASRPPPALISGFTDFTLVLVPIFGDGTQNLGLFLLSNPDLDPTSTDNYDVGLEYYFDNGGIIKASLFYKEINNLLETLTIGDADVSEIALPNDPVFDDIRANPEDYALTILLPRNNSSISTVWGAEFEYEQQFTGLPGVLSGFGLFGNIAYTDSEKEETISFQGEERVVSDVRFNTQPEYSGSVGATYNYGSIDASIGYTFQGRVFGSRENHGLDNYTAAFDTLDFRIEYFAGTGFGDWRIFLEGNDMLRDADEPNKRTEFGGEDGVPRVSLPGGTFFGGRTIRAGFIASF